MSEGPQRERSSDVRLHPGFDPLKPREEFSLSGFQRLPAMASSTIDTFLRVRPARKAAGFFNVADDHTATVDVPQDEALGFVNNKRTSWRFGFNGVLNTDSTQEDVFERVAQPVVENVLGGYNGTVFAYGQTGSGKTHTLTGGASSYAQRGIIPRAIQAIYKHVQSCAEDAEYTVRVSYLEIYNEVGYDLLDPSQGGDAAGALGQLARVAGVSEAEDGSVRLKGLSQHAVATEEAALNLLFVGDTNRAVAETSMNDASSRSHCIFTIAVECRPHGASTVRRSKLHLVDLAGSERVGKSGASGTILSEAKAINLSLHYLESVIIALHEKQHSNRSHVPYRNSLLTSVLRDSLGGNCKTVMVATVHPAAAHTDESISTCRFAQRVAQIKNEVSLNEEVDQAVLIQRLKDENRLLRETARCSAVVRSGRLQLALAPPALPSHPLHVARGTRRALLFRSPMPSPQTGPIPASSSHPPHPIHLIPSTSSRFLIPPTSSHPPHPIHLIHLIPST